MTPKEIEKWLNEFDLSGICDGTKFNALMPPADFWRYVEDGGSIHNPLTIHNHGREIELKLLPIYDPDVLNFFHVSSTSIKLMCRHNFNAFSRAYAAKGGSLDI